MQLSDFSVLHEIFQPATTSIDPKLVLTTRTSYIQPTPVSPVSKDAASPAPIPLSIQELESKPELSHLENVAPSPGAAADGKSSPIDIVHLAAEEIRKPLLKFKDEAKVFNQLF